MRKRSLRERDPFLEREKSRYTHPIPSREHILEILIDAGVPIPLNELARLLEIDHGERAVFHRRLRAMEQAGQIMRNRKGAICIVEKLNLVSGTVEGHPDGFGFLIPDDGGADIFLGPRQMQQALHGDRVMVRPTGEDRRGRREGVVVEILARANHRIVGRLFEERGVWIVRPEDRRLTHDIIIPTGEQASARSGQVVVVDLVEQPSRESVAIGRVAEVLGEYGDPGMEIEIALRKHKLPHVFPPEVENREFPDAVRPRDCKGRRDLRELPLVTIDGETAKDFDDAVYCERAGKSYRLFVAIADVGHYVKHGDALDREAHARGNSVYFPRHVIPMLPEPLSNGLCSLNPGVDRLAMVCEMDIAPRGAITGYRFYPALIRSHARLTYTEVWEMLQNGESEAARRRRDLLPHLELLYALFKVLVKAREKRGAIDFETIETRMVFDDKGKIEKILPERRSDAHRVIEECMLAANVCASEFLERHDHPTLYRVHEGPTPRKLEGLREFLKEFGLSLSGGEDPHAKDYAKLLDQVKDRPDAQLLQTVMLRSLQQAVYSPDNVGHFGLAYESYTHFTSPIRRYPDLLVHRAIKAVLADKRYSAGDWTQLGEHCSMTERRADEATRDVVAWLKCYYMRDEIGEVFDGTISGVTGFGIFVALDEVYVEGLVHVSELGNDYFQFDAPKHRLLGERTGKRYRLGDRLRVRVIRVDLDSARIDFALGEA
jgi:ribonuclease R